MENSMTLPANNMPIEEAKTGLKVKEKKDTVAKLWSKLVKTGVAIEKTKMQATPFMLKVASFAMPELAPVLEPLSKFFKTGTGKKWMEKMTKNYDAMGDALTGNTQPFKDNVKETIGLLNSEEGEKYIKESMDMVNEVKKGMTK